MDYKLFWTDQAIENLKEILTYLTENWSQKEVENNMVFLAYLHINRKNIDQIK